MTLKVRNTALILLSVLLSVVVALSAILMIKPASAESSCNATGVHIEGFNSGSTATNEITTDTVKEGDGAFNGGTGGGFNSAIMHFTAVDISKCDSISFWLYLTNANGFNQSSGQNQVMISSYTGDDTAGFDGLKRSWNLGGRDFVDGWNLVVLPFSEIVEAPGDVDFTAITTVKFNCNGFSINAADPSTYVTVIVDDLHANYSAGIAIEGFNSGSTATNEITTDTVKEGDGAFNGGTGGGFNSAIMHFTAVDISKTDAISFWLYLTNANGFNQSSGQNQIMISSYTGDDTSGFDGLKRSWNLGGRDFVDGWNLVVLPFSEIVEAPGDVDFTAITTVKFNCNGFSINAADPSTYVTVIVDDLRAIETQFIVEEDEGDEGGNETPEPEPEPVEEAECGHTGIHIEGFDKSTNSKWTTKHNNSANGLTTVESYIKQGDGAFITNGQGITDNAWQLAAPVDISDADAITFWLYLENAASFNAMSGGQFVLGNSENIDSAKIFWNLGNRGFVDGWQKVIFTMDTATKEGAAVDLTAISHMRIYFVGLPEMTVAIFDDVHANFTQGKLLEGFDSATSSTVWSVHTDGSHTLTTLADHIKQGDGAFRTVGQGITDGAWQLAAPVDITKMDAISFWLYLENAAAFNAMGDGQLVLGNSSNIDSAKIYWRLSGRSFVDGWQQVVLTIDTATAEGAAVDRTAISHMRIYFFGVSAICTAIFDDVRAIETQFLPEEIDPIKSYVVTDADSIATGIFEGMTLVYEGHKQGIASLTTTLAEGANTLNATFTALESGLKKSGNNELGLGFWLYVADMGKVTDISVALSSGLSNGTFELKWTLSGLDAGWNWIALKASNATETNVVDMNSLQRITVNVTATEAVEVRLDRVRIFNTTEVTDWNTEPDASEAIVMNPVDSTIITKADAVSDSAFSGGIVEIKDHKEGAGAIKLSGTGVKTASALSVGTTDLLAADYTPVNEFGVTMWLYIPEGFAYDKFLIAVGSSEFGIDGYTNTGRITFEVSVSDLTAGWNWLVLKASEATDISLNFNTNNIQWFLIQAQGTADADQTYAIDRISAVNVTVADAIAEPSASEKIERDPVSGKVIITCDKTDGLLFSGNTVDSADKREGKGSVRTEGAGFQLVAKELEIGKTDLTKETLVLAMWVYIEDPEFYTKDGVNGQFEISSSGKWDEQELAWEIGVGKTVDLSKFTAGWNWIVLKGADAGASGSINLDAINFFRLYINGTDYTVFKLDRITLTNIDDVDSYAEPDWESEIAGGGGDDNFSGSNISDSKNDTFIESGINGDDFEYTEMTEGCGSQISYSAFAFAFVVIGCAAVLFVRKKA